MDATTCPHQPGKTRLSPSAVINGAVGLPMPILMRIPEKRDTISALTRRAKETASHNALRWDNETIWIKAWSWRVAPWNTSADWICVNIIILSMAICGKKDTISVFKIFYEVLGGGTRLAMLKTICAPDSSSLKPGSGAIEGVLD